MVKNYKFTTKKLAFLTGVCYTSTQVQTVDVQNKTCMPLAMRTA